MEESKNKLVWQALIETAPKRLGLWIGLGCFNVQSFVSWIPTNAGFLWVPLKNRQIQGLPTPNQFAAAMRTSFGDTVSCTLSLPLSLLSDGMTICQSVFLKLDQTGFRPRQAGLAEMNRFSYFLLVAFKEIDFTTEKYGLMFACGFLCRASTNWGFEHTHQNKRSKLQRIPDQGVTLGGLSDLISAARVCRDCLLVRGASHAPLGS